MIKTKKSKDFTETTLLVYNNLTKKYGFSARLSDIWDLLRDAFSIDDFANTNRILKIMIF